MGSPECLNKHYEFRDHVARRPASNVVVTSADLVDDPLSAMHVSNREKYREAAKTIDVSRGQEFPGFLLTDASPIARDDVFVDTVYANTDRQQVGLENASQVYSAFVRIPDIHQALLVNPYDTSPGTPVKTQEKRDLYIQLHTRCVFDPNAIQGAPSKAVFAPVVVKFVDNDMSHARIIDIGAASSLPIPPLLPSEREATNRTPTHLLGDFDSLEGVDFDQECEEDGLIAGTDERRIGSEDIHHTLTDIFPSAQLPYDASEEPVPPRITSPMCLRDHPVHREQRAHNGTDISWGRNVEGKRILAPYEGTVVYTNRTRPVDELGDAGYYLVIYHGESESGNSVYTRYLHLQENSIRLNAGNKVETGQYIGKVGKTGLGTGPHLHYEIRLNMQEPFWNPTGNAIPAFVYQPGRLGSPETPSGDSSISPGVSY